MESWNVWFLLDLFLQLQSTNLEVNEKRVSFSACCTTQPFTYKLTVVRCEAFGGLVVLFYEKDWKDFFFFLSCLSSRKTILDYFSREQNASLTVVSFFCIGE